MFYRTQIKSVTAYGVVDMAGRSLSFMGYLPVQAGDWVFTDGKFIFGNVKPKGSPHVVGEESGIPVSGYDDFRGYFNRNGLFKKFRVAQDDWIVNSDKKFIHGTQYQGSEKVIDADINDKGETIIITDGIYRHSRTMQTEYIRYGHDSKTWWNNLWMYDPWIYTQILGSEAYVNELSPVNVYVNDKKESSLELTPYAQDVEARALDCAAQIMQNSFSPSQGRDYLLSEKIALLVDVSVTPHPEEPFIACTTAYVFSGSDTVFAASYGYCFPYIQPRFYHAWHPESITAFEKLGIQYGVYPILEWKCVPFGCSAVYLVDDTARPLSYHYFGGIDSNITALKSNFFFIDNVDSQPSYQYSANEAFEQRRISILPTEAEFQSEELLPVGDGFYRMDKHGRLSFFNSKKDLIAEGVPVHDDFFYLEVQFGLFNPEEYTHYLNDKAPFLLCKVYTPDGKVEDVAMVIADLVSRGEFVIVVNDPDTGEITYITENIPGGAILDPTYSVIDKIYVEQADTLNNIPPMDGYYVRQADGSFEPLQFTPLFYQFNEDVYIYGVKGGKLYKNVKGIQSVAGDDVKNFRLRELNNISKSIK